MALKRARFEVFPARRTKSGAARWGLRFRGRNGEVWSGSETYTRRRDAVRSATGLRFSVPGSDIVILDGEGEVVATPLEMVSHVRPKA